jgi:hypothetical protein
VDFDLRATWQGKAMPWLVLPETKGNRWTSAARIVPLPDCLLPILQELLPDDRQIPAFSFRTQGRLVAADKGEIRQRLAELDMPCQSSAKEGRASSAKEGQAQGRAANESPGGNGIG